MDVKLFLIGLSIAIISSILYAKRHAIIAELALAAAVGLTWTWFYPYQYIGSNIAIGRINLYPLCLWVAGLLLLAVVYQSLRSPRRFLLAALLYWLLLFAGEAIGYYLLGVRLNSHYPSLLGLGIIHAPGYVQIFYLTAGPLYLLAAQKMGMFEFPPARKTTGKKTRRYQKLKKLLLARIN